MRRAWSRMMAFRRLILLSGVCLGLTAIPLVGALGYENSVVLAPVLALMGIGVSLDHARTARTTPTPPSRGTHLGQITWDLLPLHVAAIATLLLGRWWLPSCDPLGGLRFYVAGPVLSGFVGATVGLWAALLFRRRSAQWVLAIGIMALSIGVGLWRLYQHPVVFAYDPFVGYFSGSLYDEAITVSTSYWRFRAYNCVAIASAVFLWWLFIDTRLDRIERRPTTQARVIGMSIASLGLALYGWVTIHAADYGFSATRISLRAELSSTIETEHFTIYYAPRSANAREIDSLALEHEFAWHELEQAMSRAPDGKVESFIFSDPEQKRRLMGAGSVQVAAPWRRQIYLDHRSFPHPVLHHELAHIFAGTIGDPWLGIARRGIRVNMGLVEGLATALAPRTAHGLDLHGQAKVLDELERRPPLTRVMGAGFFGLNSRVAYTAAGSFCRWLIDTHGFEPMATLYRTAGDFDEAYQTPLAELEQEWVRFLATEVTVNEADVERQAIRFMRGSVFERPCAHVVAEVQTTIALAEHQGLYDDAIAGHEHLCSLEPGNPLRPIDLAEALARAHRAPDALAVLDQAAAMPRLRPTIEATIAELRGDIHLELTGNLEAAREAYDEALAVPLSDARRRVLLLKRLASIEREHTEILRRYFGLFEQDDTGAVHALTRFDAAIRLRDRSSSRALGHYLWAWQLLHIQDPHAAIPPLQQAVQLAEQLPSREFVIAAREALLGVSLQASNFDLARQTLADLRAIPGRGPGDHLDDTQWSRRIAFFEAATRP